MDEVRDIVRRGYNEALYHEEYREDMELPDYQRRFLERFLDELPDDGRVLDLGAGSGEPYDRFFIEHGLDVTGVEFADRQLELAREHVPEAQYINADMLEYDPDEQYDGVVALYSVFHLPRDKHGSFFEQVADALVPGGLFLASLYTKDIHRVRERFGAEIVWSSFDAATSRSLLRDAGLKILEQQLQPDSDSYMWVFARKPD